MFGQIKGLAERGTKSSSGSMKQGHWGGCIIRMLNFLIKYLLDQVVAKLL